MAVSEKMKYPAWKIDPAECHGACETCQYDDTCDHIRATRSQQIAITVSGILLFALIAGFFAFIIAALIMEKL